MYKIERDAIGNTAANHLPETSSGQKEGEAAANVNLTIGDKIYQARFFDHETAEALMYRMPMELDMKELHGNEKYYYLSAGAVYGGHGNQFLRMNAACPRTRIEDGLNRLKKGIKSVKAALALLFTL